MKKQDDQDGQQGMVDPKVLIDELTLDLQRIQADFINFKKRAEEERSMMLKLGKESAVKELLPVFDNLERAFAHIPQELAAHNWVKGIAGLDKQLATTMKSFGLEKIEVLGKVFDANLMEAVSVEEEGGSEEVVSEELQAGYSLNGAVVRPAMVKVRR